MGQLYETGLRHLRQTYQWALRVPVEPLCSFVKTSTDLPLIAVGSGGSLTAAHMAALLHQRIGMISKGVTPLRFISSEKLIRDAAVLILSAGGRNSDILSALRVAAKREPRQLMALSMRTGSPLSTISKEFRYSRFLDLDLPSGRDGFLATNSLLAFVTILIRAYQEVVSGNWVLPKNLPSLQEMHEQLSRPAWPLLERDTWLVLYAGWGLPVALDVESKFTEAALGHVQTTDYRNFAHGRHYWLAKRASETGVLALVTRDEARIAKRTLELLPKTVPVLQLISDTHGPVGTLDLLIRMLHLVHLAGTVRGIDPGRPRVPAFGRRIYHLRLPSRTRIASLPRTMTRRETIAVVRKSKYTSLIDMTAQELEYWRNAYSTFVSKLQDTTFATAVFDYDGTLCDPNQRFSGLLDEVGSEILRLLRGGMVIGIATGRGKSVRTDLRRLVPTKYRARVLVGYYNGADVASLDEPGHPNSAGPLDVSLQPVKYSLENHQEFLRTAKYECRPKQITVEPLNQALWKKTISILRDTTAQAKASGVQVLESGHSIDVIAPGVSKLHLVDACVAAAREIGNSGVALCIGDKGEWPGNDYDLLSSPYSISVDTISTDPATCWNLSRAGHRGVQATLAYLKCMEVSKGMLRFRLRTQGKTL